MATSDYRVEVEQLAKMFKDKEKTPSEVLVELKGMAFRYKLPFNDLLTLFLTLIQEG